VRIAAILMERIAAILLGTARALKRQLLSN
jgi:hypothetical protein